MKYLFTFFLIISFCKSYSQNIQTATVLEIKNKTINKVLTSIESLTFEKGKKLEFSLFKINNGSGSAHVIGDDEISESYLIGVTESFGDEAPSIKYFSIGPFYNPQIISKKDLGNTYIIVLYHGSHKKSRNHKIIITLDNVTYQ